ncbi:MAG: hypothetical protein QM704_05765 [Anaeromyxobacteraceae bacterium]
MKTIATFVTALTAAAVLAAPRSAAAGECYGIPSSLVFAQAGYDDVESVTGTAGVYVDRGTLSVNYVKLKNPPNGSKLTSVGLRYTHDLEERNPERRFNACALLGFQLAQGWLVNANGLRANARLTSRIVPMGLGLSYRLVGSPRFSVVAFAIPQLRLISHDMQVYARSGDPVDGPSEPTQYGSALGATVALGPVYARATFDWTKGADSGWTVALGAGW